MKRIAVRALSCLLLCVMLFTAGGCASQSQNMYTAEPETAEEERKDVEKADDIISEESTVTAKENVIESLTESEALEDLNCKLSDIISQFEGEWAIAVYDLGSDDSFVINSHQMRSASIIKLFIMATVLDEIDRGKLDLDDDIDYLLRRMITESHNESSNELVRQLSPTRDDHPEGMKVVNKYAQDHGYVSTSQGRDMLDVRKTPVEGENYTSVEDAAKLLKEIYHGSCVNKEYSLYMLDLLKAQKWKHKIPAGLPEGVVCANKTGELDDVENDCAIVFGEKTDYILCVMSEGISDKKAAQLHIKQISEEVYGYLNG